MMVFTRSELETIWYKVKKDESKEKRRKENESDSIRTSKKECGGIILEFVTSLDDNSFKRDANTQRLSFQHPSVNYQSIVSINVPSWKK